METINWVKEHQSAIHVIKKTYIQLERYSGRTKQKVALMLYQ